MLGMMLAMMSQQQAVEITPSLDSLSLATIVTGTCGSFAPSVSSKIRVTWSATSYNLATQTYKLYRDGILVATQTGPTYDYTVAGLKENDPHHEQDITFNYRVDIARNSDSQVLASRSISVTKSYGDCDTRAPI